VRDARALQQPARTFTWPHDLQEKLRKLFLIVGSGTWQSIWAERRKASIGFHADEPLVCDSVQQKITRAGTIPAELLRRFSSELIILPPATKQDYREGAKVFGLDTMARELQLDLNYDEAVERALGARGLEETLAHLLRVARRTGKPIITAVAPIPANEAGVDIEGDSNETIPLSVAGLLRGAPSLLGRLSSPHANA